MTSRHKKYFSFFGVLCASVKPKLLSKTSAIHMIIINNIPKITKLLMAKALRPAKLYSTNIIK